MSANTRSRTMSSTFPTEGDGMTTTHEAPTRNGDYIVLDGVRTYYEMTGTGEPLILLHGGLCTSETWDAQTTALAGQDRVFTPERFGHGRTPDTEGPITHEHMAQHTIALRQAPCIWVALLGVWRDA